MNFRVKFQLFAVLAALCVSVFVTSCKKETDLPARSNSNATSEPHVSDGSFEEEDCEDFPECFALNYPVTVIMPDGSTTSVGDDDALEALFDGLDEEDDLMFQFPITVTLEEDGSTQSVADEDAFVDMLDECFGDGWDEDFDCDEDEWEDWPECFEVNYPVSVCLPDGSNVTLQSDADLDALFDDLDEEEDIEIHYPITVTLEDDGSTETINNDDELEELMEMCEWYWDDEYGCDEDDFDDFEDCFTVNFPISLTMADGSTQQVNSEDDIDTLVDNLSDAEADAIEVVYPVTVTMNDDGSTQTVASDDAFEALLDSCD